MKDYANYDLEDFIEDKEFMRWVFENRPEDDSYWQRWIQLHPHKREVVEDAVIILRSMKINEEQISEEKAQREIKIILSKTKKQQMGVVFTLLTRWKHIAILVGIIAAGVLFYAMLRSRPIVNENLADNSLPHKTKNIVEEVNTGNAKKIVRLEDGSTIHLSPKAVIRYSNQLASAATRDIYLSGEAFFEVAKNPNHPFRVFTHDLVTKVLGTSFTIKANEKDEKFSVIVKTGKVSVYDRNNENNKADVHSSKLDGLVLVPNQELEYFRKQHKFRKILTDQPVLINPSEIKNDFLYEDAPVTEVLEQLKKAFGINIIYDQDIIENCRITADLSNESIYKKLELICSALDAEYEIIDGQVSIKQMTACD